MSRSGAFYASGKLKPLCSVEGCERPYRSRGMCAAHYQHTYRLDYFRAWKAANRTHVRAYERERRANQPERKKELDAAWREANRERTREASRRFAAAHPDRIRDNTAHQRARRRSAPIAGVVRRQDVWERDEGICGLCNLPADRNKWHLDHIVPLSAGGHHSMDNVQVSHPTCNWRKGRKWTP